MSSKLYAGKGTLVECSVDGTTWLHVLQVRKMDHGGMKADFDDGSNFDSPGAYKEFVPTMIDGGEFSGDGVLNPQDASFATFNTYFNNQTQLRFRLTYIDGTVDSFVGYVSELKPISVETTKLLGYSFKLKITGQYTRTPASGATPTITNLTPSTTAVGNPVKIVGTNFYNSRGTGGVTVNAVAATVLSWSDTVIVIEVPSTTTGNVVVTNASAVASVGTHTLTIS